MRTLDLNDLSDTLRQAIDALGDDGEPVLIVHDGEIVARLETHPPKRRGGASAKHQVAGSITVQGDLVINVEGDVIAPIEPQEGWDIEYEFEDGGGDYDDEDYDEDDYPLILVEAEDDEEEAAEEETNGSDEEE